MANILDFRQVLLAMTFNRGLNIRVTQVIQHCGHKQTDYNHDTVLI